MDYSTDILLAAKAAQYMWAYADEDLARLPETVRALFLVHAAQGVIDNGGYRFFFD